MTKLATRRKDLGRHNLTHSAWRRTLGFVFDHADLRDDSLVRLVTSALKDTGGPPVVGGDSN